MHKLRSEFEAESRKTGRSIISRESLSSVRGNEEYAELETKIEELEK